MGWLVGWPYRKKITITGSSGAGSGYQVLLKVGESGGASVYDFHVEGHSEKFPTGKNDSGDLRFTSSDGKTLLNIWVEKVEGTAPNRTAYVWVKVEDDLSTDVDIYCYYGNVDADNISDGDSTFIFFDDFEDGNYDNWTYSTYKSGDTLKMESVNPLEGNYSLKLHEASSYGYVKIWSSYIENCDVRLKVKAKQTGYRYLDKGSGMGFVILFYDESNSLLKSLVWTVYTTAHPENHGDWTENAPSVQRVDDWNLPDSEIGERELDIGLYKPSNAVKIRIKAIIQNVDTGDFWVDLFRVRKFADPEPTFSLAGAEEGSRLSGTACDKNGDPIVGKAVKVFVFDKETGELLGQTTSDSNGNWTCEPLFAEPNAKVVTVLTLEGDYNGDIDIAGAEFNITQPLN